MKVNGAPEVGPGAEQRVEQAVTGIAKGASEGDEQLQQALSLLAAGIHIRAAEMDAAPDTRSNFLRSHPRVKTARIT